MIRSAITLIWLLLCPAFTLLAQAGPGGVGTATSNGLWLRADAINSADGSLLNTWPDQSAYGNSASMDTVRFRPSYYASSQLNGQPIVRLDGINDRLLIPDHPVLDGSSGITYFAVLRPNDLNGSTPHGILGKRIDFTVNENYAYTWFFYNNGNDLSLDVNSNSNRFSSGSTKFANATNYILSWDFDGARPTATRARQYSGSLMISSQSISATSINSSNRPVVLGALNDNYRDYLGADYAEVIHYNYALNITERLIVNNYLSGKYAIPLASGDLYVQDNAAQGNYDHDIAGIGRTSITDLHASSRGSGLLTIENPQGLDDNEFLFWGHDGTEVTESDPTDLPPTVIERMSRLWRVSEVTAAGSSTDVGAIDLTFDLKNVGAYTADNVRLLVDTDNDGSFADETPIGGAQLTGDEVYTFTGIAAIADGNRFTVAMADANLPVTLTQFTATTAANNSSVVLQWNTSTESDNDYFQIERSAVGHMWNEIGRVQGAGTVMGERQYRYIDREPLRGRALYRLRQVDYDGSFTLSDIRAVSPDDNPAPTLYPNPVVRLLTIKDGGEPSSLHLYSTSGRDLTSRITVTPAASGKVTLDLGTLRKGQYILKYGTKNHLIIKH